MSAHLFAVFVLVDVLEDDGLPVGMVGHLAEVRQWLLGSSGLTLDMG